LTERFQANGFPASGLFANGNRLARYLDLPHATVYSGGDIAIHFSWEGNQQACT